MSETSLPGGEAQLAEVRTHDGSSAIVFNSRLKSPLKRGIAWSYDYGKSFTEIREVEDLTGGASCDSSILSLETHPIPAAAAAASAAASGAAGVPSARTRSVSPLLFSHPSGENRTHKAGRNAGVLLRSDDGAQTWREVGSATPEDPSRKFGYSNLNWNSLMPRVLAGQDSDGSRGRLSVGLTDETEAEGCDPALESSACQIIYRTFELKGAVEL